MNLHDIIAGIDPFGAAAIAALAIGCILYARACVRHLLPMLRSWRERRARHAVLIRALRSGSVVDARREIERELAYLLSHDFKHKTTNENDNRTRTHNN